MKLFVSILTSLVLFLSTQCIIMGNNLAISSKTEQKPSCSESNSCGQASEEPAGDCEDEEGKDCNDACNPFMACCGCLYDAASKNDFTISKPILKPEKNGFNDDFFKSAFLPALWQPPEGLI